MKKLSPVFLILLVACINSLFSQSVSTFTPIINSMPTSPEAALLGRFGDIPIGYYTGTADISIPLYTIKESGIEIPIQLRYHNSGIKVKDEATWVGLGWDLSPGGEIIQEVRGNRDEYDEFNLNSSPTQYANFKNRLNNVGPIGNNKYFKQKGRAGYVFYNAGCSMWAATDSPDDEPDALVGNLILGGGNPDIYHYKFGRYSGKFYINPETYEVVLIDPNKEIKFESLGPSSGWKATTLDGNVFFFSAIETAYELGYYPYSQKSGKTYKLSSITFTNGKSIFFNYSDAHLVGGSFTQRSVLYTLAENQPDALSPSPPQYISFQSDIKLLTSITTDNEIIDFNLENREDLYQDANNPVKRLKSIDITSAVSAKKIKSFEFNYSYFPYNFIGAPRNSGGDLVTYSPSEEAANGKRLKLDSIQEIGYDNNGVADTSKPPYELEYDTSITMPLKISYAVDFYGYYNGENNDTFMPELDYFDYPYTYKTWTNGSLFIYNYTGADRFTNNEFAGANLLKKITYPTSGYSEFGFEPNSFTNQYIPDKDKLGNSYRLNVLEDKNYSTDVIGKTFQLAKATTISFENNIYDGYIPNMVTGYNYSQMTGSYIELLKVDMSGGPLVTSIKKWDLSTVLNVDFTNNHGKQWLEDVRIEYDPNPSIYYTVNVSLPNNLNNNSYGSVSVSSRFHYYDDTGVDTSVSNQCGMRIKSIKNYTETGVLANNKAIRYYDGKLLNRFDPIMTQNVWYFEYNGGCPDQNGINFNEVTLFSDLIKEGGNLIGYGKVEEINLSTLNSNDNTGKKSFTYFNTENLASQMFPLVINLKNGQLLGEFFYDSAVNLLLEKKYSYEDLNDEIIKCFYGISIVNNFRGDYDPLDKGEGSINSRSKYSYLATPIISEWNKLSHIETIDYYNGKTINTNEEYTYNDKGSISTLIKTNSNNKSLTTKYFYPQDPEMGSKPYRTSLLNNNIFEPALVTQKIEGLNNKLSEQELRYGAFGSLLLPQYIYAGKGTLSTEKKITYDQYDDKGNLLQYTLENGTPVSLIWGYNQTLPIAKIENTSYVSIPSATITNLQTLSDADNDRTINEGALRAALNNLCTALPNAMLTTYTYDPLVGVTSITDTKGYTTSYEYDAFNRLEYVKDADGKILNKNEYHYKGQL